VGRLRTAFFQFQTIGRETGRRLNLFRVFGPAFVGTAIALSLLPGCGRRDGLIPPTYSPDEFAQEALAEYDTNHDGYLDAKELERCPALKYRLETIDQNGDHRLSVQEIAGRIQIYADSQIALKSVLCSVQLDGRPLQGATVTYVPEKFMGSSIKPASGVSDERGGVSLTVPGEKLNGVQPGFYRVQISKKNASGQETIPARYNQESILGAEVYPRKLRTLGMEEDETGKFRLSSKGK
jgi:hypothetical protein